MKKIPTVFLRDKETHLVTQEVHAYCQWVLDGEGVAHYKWDGTCCMLMNTREGLKLYKRRQLRLSQYDEMIEKIGFIIDDPCELGNPLYDGDKIHGWVPVDDKDPADHLHRKGLKRYLENNMYDFNKYDPREFKAGEKHTLELVGNGVNSNRHGLYNPILIDHRKIFSYVISYFNYKNERQFDELKEFFKKCKSNIMYIEGFVFHHPDGRMAKIKLRDFFRD